jgi:3-oxoacyl-[acyl-carrier-protein] synthase II
MTKAAYKDHLGRPLVAVTGMGVVTSLGQGIEDNWSAFDCRRIRHSSHHPFSLRQPLDQNLRNGRFYRHPVPNAVERSFAFARETTIEALAHAGISGEFGGPLFLAAPPIEPEWSARFELGDRVRPEQMNGNAYEQFLAVLRENPIRPSRSSFVRIDFGTISPTGSEPAACR